MKDGWIKKTLGDTCQLYQPKTIPNKEFVEDGPYPVYGSNGIIGKYDKYNHTERELLVACRGTCGKVNVSVPYSWINGNAMVVHIQQPGLSFDFLKYQLMGLDMSEAITGATIPQITRKSLSPLSILIPPIDIQNRIVAELDCLSEVIRKKRVQLSELDSLENSLFYEMFGDPIINDKHWEIKRLGDVCDVRDGTHDSPKYVEHSDYILITSKNIVDGKIDYTDINYIKEEDYIAINQRSKVDDGDIIMAMIGTIGKPIIVRMEDYKFCIKNVALIKFYPSSRVSNVFVRSLLDSPSYANHIMSLNKGGTQKFVALGTIRGLLVPIPPIELQEQFAKRSEAIKKQKELIKKSIDETESLFNSRMDYWFS